MKATKVVLNYCLKDGLPNYSNQCFSAAIEFEVEETDRTMNKMSALIDTYRSFLVAKVHEAIEHSRPEPSEPIQPAAAPPTPAPLVAAAAPPAPPAPFPPPPPSGGAPAHRRLTGRRGPRKRSWAGCESRTNPSGRVPPTWPRAGRSRPCSCNGRTTTSSTSITRC